MLNWQRKRKKDRGERKLTLHTTYSKSTVNYHLPTKVKQCSVYGQHPNFRQQNAFKFNKYESESNIIDSGPKQINARRLEVAPIISQAYTSTSLSTEEEILVYK